LFIAGQAFPLEADFEAAKIAVFMASLLASILGIAALWVAGRGSGGRTDDFARSGARGSAV
jgi:NhaA family Na+:H+ antiporter